MRFRVDTVKGRFYVESDRFPVFREDGRVISFITNNGHEKASFPIANVVRWVKL